MLLRSYKIFLFKTQENSQILKYICVKNILYFRVNLTNIPTLKAINRLHNINELIYDFINKQRFNYYP